MEIVQFGLIGGGWRAEFYLRIARALPERFRVVGAVLRDAAKAAAFGARWGVPTFPTPEALLDATAPEFVVTSVPRDANPAILTVLAARGVPALSETPPANGLEDLCRVWALAEAGARIQVAEQYAYQPHHAARLACVASGRLGSVSQVQVSVAHGYHGLSLLRRFLGVRGEAARITARRFSAPLVGGPGRGGPPAEERLTTSQQTIAWLDFGDRLGVYDFDGAQYFSWVRGQRLLVRGDRGEVIDERARYLLSYREPMEASFERLVAGANGNLEGMYLKGIALAGEWLYRNPFAPARLTDEEIAVAAVLDGMARYVAGGPDVYSLAEACQDRYLDLVLTQAAESGETLETEPQPWSEALAEG